MKDIVRRHFVYQVRLAVVAVCLTTAVAWFGLGDVNWYLGIGDLSRKPGAIPWLGIKGHESWSSLGFGLSLSISMVTFALISIAAKKQGLHYARCFRHDWPWILLFSVTNTFAEELIFRVSLVSVALMYVSPDQAILVSAVVFGIVHLRSRLGGLVGVLWAGVLGAFLAKSMIETGGIALAFGLHFLQDVLLTPLRLQHRTS